jgi:putative component of membrane protein insertase Oxa1/YidC/SpoIIIJ protein YidD
MSRSISEIDVPKCRWKPCCSARIPVPAAAADGRFLASAPAYRAAGFPWG